MHTQSLPLRTLWRSEKCQASPLLGFSLTSLQDKFVFSLIMLQSSDNLHLSCWTCGTVLHSVGNQVAWRFQLSSLGAQEYWKTILKTPKTNNNKQNSQKPKQKNNKNPNKQHSSRTKARNPRVHQSLLLDSLPCWTWKTNFSLLFLVPELFHSRFVTAEEQRKWFPQHNYVSR